MIDSQGREIKAGDTAEVVVYDTSRGATANLLHIQAKVTGFGRNRVTIELENPVPGRWGKVTRSVGPETLLVWFSER